MVDKEIIIDGVDVSECDRYIANDGYMSIYKTPVFKGDCKLSHIGKCQGSECLFKRFIYKEQECGELKRQLNSKFGVSIVALIDSRARAKMKANIYREALDDIKKITQQTCNDCSEIRKHCGYGAILDIINKARKE